MLSTILYFMLALLLLITVHEYGHFIVARWCGVKVLRFSFGFGKVLARWRDKKGTEYAWSLVPLGGYVKMLDEADGPVSRSQQHLTIESKPLWARSAIVLAGPLFNFLFAFIALWLALMIGIRSLAPMIGEVKPNSPAANAGLMTEQEILSVNGRAVRSWHDFHYAMMPLFGTVKPIHLTVQPMHGGQLKTVILPLEADTLVDSNTDTLESLGIKPFIPAVPAVVGEVAPNSAASASELRPGDKIVRLNDVSMTDWFALLEFIKKHPDEDIRCMVSRAGKIKTFMLHTGSEVRNGHNIGVLGIRSQKPDWPKHWLRIQQYSPFDAVGIALNQTVGLVYATGVLMGRLIQGKLPMQTLGGPVGIAQGASASAKSGAAYYLFFLALLSVGLGVLNLLPIPMLDGGHLLYYIIEAVRRRPLSTQSKTIGVYCGLVVLGSLTMIALHNDLLRLAGPLLK